MLPVYVSDVCLHLHVRERKKRFRCKRLRCINVGVSMWVYTYMHGRIYPPKLASLLDDTWMQELNGLGFRV